MEKLFTLSKFFVICIGSAIPLQKNYFLISSIFIISVWIALILSIAWIYRIKHEYEERIKESPAKLYLLDILAAFLIITATCINIIYAHPVKAQQAYVSNKTFELAINDYFINKEDDKEVEIVKNNKSLREQIKNERDQSDNKYYYDTINFKLNYKEYTLTELLKKPIPKSTDIYDISYSITHNTDKKQITGIPELINPNTYKISNIVFTKCSENINEVLSKYADVKQKITVDYLYNMIDEEAGKGIINEPIILEITNG